MSPSAGRKPAKKWMAKLVYALSRTDFPCRDLLHDQQLPTGTCVTGNGRVRSFRDKVPLVRRHSRRRYDDAASRSVAWGLGKFRMRNGCESSINLVI